MRRGARTCRCSSPAFVVSSFTQCSFLATIYTQSVRHALAARTSPAPPSPNTVTRTSTAACWVGGWTRCVLLFMAKPCSK